MGIEPITFVDTALEEEVLESQIDKQQSEEKVNLDRLYSFDAYDEIASAADERSPILQRANFHLNLPVKRAETAHFGQQGEGSPTSDDVMSPVPEDLPALPLKKSPCLRYAFFE